MFKIKQILAKYLTPDLLNKLEKETKRRKELELMLEKILYDEKLNLPIGTTLDIFECLHNGEDELN